MLWRRCLALLGAVALLAGCQRLVLPLDRQLSSVTPEAESDAQVVHLVACWEGEPLADLLQSAYEQSDPDAAVFLTLTHSAQAIELLQSGDASLGLVSTPRGSEPDVPEGWVAREVAIDGIALIASSNLELTSLNASELISLYGGHVLDWSELGVGEGEPAFVTREAGAVLRQVFTAQIMGETAISSAAVVQPHTQAALQFVAQDDGAIAYVPAAQVDESVQVVAIRNMLPTAAQIGSGAYPLTYSLWLVLPVSTSGSTDGGALRLATFALSTQGERAIAETYVTP